MYVLGVWGTAGGEGRTPPRGGHDASAVLVKDGEVVAAIEEERLCRVKHTRRPPLKAVDFCLHEAGITRAEVDTFAVGMRWRRDSADVLHKLLGFDVQPERCVFVDHHVAHAYSAYSFSGFDSALVATIDGMGDCNAGIIGVGHDGHVEPLRELSIQDSLGLFYLRGTKGLGYRLFDEYKVMGLAPYGDPARFRPLLQRLYALDSDGRYRLFMNRADDVYRAVPPPADRDEFTQEQKDLAASLQDALETIVLHVLGHFAAITGQRRLCLAGGVAHNCSMNRRIASAGLFDEVFVQPASHDAGTALGAAAFAYQQRNATAPVALLRHVYVGGGTPDGESLRAELEPWERWLCIRREEDICRTTAKLLAEGAVVGWMQGRCEFGPRALGNRSILADPRPAGNKDRINAMIKKREAYRPFAPSVLLERAAEFFELPNPEQEYPFMTIAVMVREEKRPLLGAITHVNGTARVQTVSRSTNERYWRLIRDFGLETGVPIVLNTSFNNNHEPIVESVDDGLNCFLGSTMDYFVVGDYLVQLRSSFDWLRLAPLLADHTTLCTDADRSRYSCRTEDPIHGVMDGTAVSLSSSAFDVLARADGRTSWRDLLGPRLEGDEELVTELRELWERRICTVRPAPVWTPAVI